MSYTGDLFIDRQHKNLFLHWQHQRRRRWFLVSGGAPRRPGKPPGNREGERVLEEQIITLKPLNSSGKPEERRRRRARPATGVGGDAWIPSIHGFPTSVGLWRRSCSALGDVDHARALWSSSSSPPANPAPHLRQSSLKLEHVLKEGNGGRGGGGGRGGRGPRRGGRRARGPR